MSVAVSDTSPLNYLIKIALSELLPQLYRKVLVPSAVVEELSHDQTPSVRTWLHRMPPWVEVRVNVDRLDPALDGLVPGERAAIHLAEEIRPDLLLMDERLGVACARRRGFNVYGTLGVLLLAASHGTVDIDQAVDKLGATNFRCKPGLFDEVRRIGRRPTSSRG